jgi:hypothetical protein
MKDRHAPRLALALLERFVPDSEPIAGDLVEEFDAGRSALWFWVQALAAVVAAAGTQRVEVRPLHLVDLQPADAVERARRLCLRFPAVNLTASPVRGVGGLGLAILAGVVTWVTPAAWWVFLASALAGCALGVVAIAVREHRAAAH